jgi:1,4-alpha-glucan branching enzyme
VVVVERGDLVMVFNFHPTTSYTDYRVGCNNGGELSCEQRCTICGGFDRQYAGRWSAVEYQQPSCTD